MSDPILFVLTALSLISILVLVSVGMAIIFGMMNVINLAHGEFVTLGAYTTALAAFYSGSFWVGLVIAPIAAVLAGLLLEASLIRHLYRRPVDTIIATLGVSLIAQKSFEIILGPSPMSTGNPLPGLITILGTPYPIYRLFVIGLAVVVIGSVLIVYRRTDLGIDLRAAIQDPDMARVLGVNVDRTYRIAFASGTGLAALAGVLVAPITSIAPGMGLAYLIKSFFVVIVGGTGSILGVLAGAGFIGSFESFFSFQVGGAFPQAMVLVLAIVLVRFRPRGLVAT